MFVYLLTMNGRKFNRLIKLASLSVLLFTGCASTINNSAPKPIKYGSFRITAADNPTQTGYQSWSLHGKKEVTNWINNAFAETKASKPVTSPWLDTEYFIVDYTSAILAITEFRKWAGNKSYIPSARDCDDFAFAFKSWFQFQMADSYSESNSASLVSVVFVKQINDFGRIKKTNKNHALIFIGTDKGFLVVEPQTGVYCLLDDYPNKAYLYYMIR